LPTHWLGSTEVSLLELPDAPAPPVVPEPDPMLGLVVELPLLPEPPALPELCAQVTVARPRRAAATAALSFFAITMILSFG